MELNDLRYLRGMSKEESRSYLHELVDFIVDESYSYEIEHGNVRSATIDDTTDLYYGVALKGIFHEIWVFDNEKGWINT